MPWTFKGKMTTADKILAGLSYPTGGIAGLLYIIFNRSANDSDFFRFHFLQAILLAIIGMLVNWALSFFVGIMSAAIGAFNGIAPGAAGGVALAIDMLWKVACLLPIYGMIWAFLGKYAEIPFISSLVRQQMR